MNVAKTDIALLSTDASCLTTRLKVEEGKDDSTIPELIPSKCDPKQASSTSLSMPTFAPWPKITKSRERHQKEGRLDLLWRRITQKLQIQPYDMVFLVPLDAFFHCAIDEHDVMPSRPQNETWLPWKVYCPAIGRRPRGSLEPGPSRAKGCSWRQVLGKGPGVY